MRFGIDLGGTKIEILALDNNDEEILRHRVATDKDSYEANIKNMADLVNHASKETGERGTVGIATPGSLSLETGLLRGSNATILNDKPIKEDLEKILGHEIRIANDANCFAKSEYKLGVIKEKYPNAKIVFGVIMGTGVGGGLIVNGEIINGKNGIGGEWGHNFLDNSGGDCYCGNVGCVEKIISGPALESYYYSKSGVKKSLKEIVVDYRNQTDPIADDTMQRLFFYFSKSISQIINVVDPDVIVIGGGVGNIDELYTEGLKHLPSFVFSDYIETQFTKPMYGDSSGVLGAALL